MKKNLLLAMLIVTLAALSSVAIQAQDITLTYMTSQGWVFDAEMELGLQFEEQKFIEAIGFLT